MKYCRPFPHHFDLLVALQNKNLISALNETERKEGFLSTAFTKEQFQLMDHLLGIIVCLENDIVCGYLCATTIEFNLAFPIPAAMIENCANLQYKDRPLNSYQYVVASPSCIDKNYRGKDIFVNLCKKLSAIIPAQYELTVSLVSTKNNTSLAAVKKIGLKPIQQFVKDGEEFWILVCELNEFRSIFL